MAGRCRKIGIRHGSLAGAMARVKCRTVESRSRSETSAAVHGSNSRPDEQNRGKLTEILPASGSTICNRAGIWSSNGTGSK